MRGMWGVGPRGSAGVRYWSSQAHAAVPKHYFENGSRHRRRASKRFELNIVRRTHGQGTETEEEGHTLVENFVVPNVHRTNT